MEVLAAVVVLSFVVERALAIIFESEFYVKYLSSFEIKEVVAFALSFYICWHWQFDIVSVLLRGETMSVLGEAITGAVIAGGSKASLKLFRDVIGIQSSAEKERRATEQHAGQGLPA
jgi:hypothetical protein